MTWPTVPVPRVLPVNSRSFNFYSETDTGRTQSRDRGAHRWEFELVYWSLRAADFAPVKAYALQQNGTAGVFPFIPPIEGYQSGDAVGNVSANGSAAAGASEILLNPFTGTLKAGDFFVCAGHSKAYMITEDRTGAGVLKFFPALRVPVASAESLTYDAVPFTVRLAEDLQAYEIENSGRYVYSAQLIEVT